LQAVLKPPCCNATLATLYEDIVMNKETPKTPNKFSDTIDAVIQRIGHALMWTNCIVILLIILQVILRYGFGHGLVILEELQWHFYAVAFMFGLSYAVTTDSHVGMDLFYDRFSPKWQCRWDIFGIIFLLLPFAGLLFYQSLDFVHEAWRLNERSVAPQGLPWRWAIKSVLPISFALVVLASFSRLVRTFSTLRRL
jgi:TRAP-type mannitol/chloroaromatic compound transport system permease small subunit